MLRMLKKHLAVGNRKSVQCLVSYLDKDQDNQVEVYIRSKNV
jgi:hypothetical protein